MATVSKDGTWKFWDIDGEGKRVCACACGEEYLKDDYGLPLFPVRYQMREDPRLLQSEKLVEQVSMSSLCALSPDARVVAVAVTTSIYLYSTSSGELLNTLSNVHGGREMKMQFLPEQDPFACDHLLFRSPDEITSLSWEPSSLHLASAGGADRHIRLWRNAPGQKELVRELEARIPKATSEPLKAGLHVYPR